MRTPRAGHGTAYLKLAVATAALLAKGTGLISRLDQSILRRVADLSF